MDARRGRTNTALEEAGKKHAEQHRRMRRLVSETFRSPAGVETLRMIMNECCYQKNIVAADRESGDVQINSTLYNAALRNFYLKLRSFVDREVLIQVENPPVTERQDGDE